MKSSLNGDKRENNSPETSISREADLFKLVEDLQTKIASLEANKASVNETGSVELIAADDFLESPAIFFAYSTSFALNGDKRRGKYVESPGGEMIKFRKAYRYEKRSASKRGVDIVSTCSVRVQSKSLAEWLRNHSLFGIKFFENMKEAQNIDVSFAEKMTQVQGLVSSMSDMQIIERAKGVNGININTLDIDNIRKQLVEKLARIEMENESKQKVKRYVNGQGKQEKNIDERKIATGAIQGDVY